MNLKYIDIHSHLGFEDYGADQKEVIKRMQDAGVVTIAVGADLETSREAVKVANENENVWACIGQHPTHNIIDSDNNNQTNFRHSESEVNHGSLGLAPRNFGEVGFDEKEFEKLITNPKVVAVGECGLEYYKLEDKFLKGESLALEGLTMEKFIQKEKERQKQIFIKQIKLAIKYNKPLMLHIRDGEKSSQGEASVKSAFDDAYEILCKIKLEQGLTLFRGDVHFFTGKLPMAQKFIELGFTISFVGLITYVRDFDKIIKNVPLESLQAETDAPYVAPVPHRGERNEPLYVIEIYKKIAEIRGEDPEKVRFQLLENAKRMFGV